MRGESSEWRSRLRKRILDSERSISVDTKGTYKDIQNTRGFDQGGVAEFKPRIFSDIYVFIRHKKF